MPGADNVSKLSIIIPTLNEERHVGDLLSDVASQTRMPDEVIVPRGLREELGRPERER
jgi:cellulose synthase/poly-beta-1,6-N-acetylglucosamine synthase-like glycosyltransferase